MSTFDKVKFFCTSTLTDQRKVELTLLLEHNGAQPAPLGEATHIITRSLDYERQDDANEGSVTVTVCLSRSRSYPCVSIIEPPGFLGRPVLNPRKISVVS